MRKIISMLVAVCLLVSALSFVACGEDTVKKIKQYVNDAQVYVSEGLTVVDEYEANAYLSASQASVARAALTGLKTAIDEFIKYGATIKKIDWKSKHDLLELFAAVVKGADEFQSKAGPTIIAVLEALNASGVIKIANPQQLVARVSAVLHGLNIAVGLVKSRLENLDVPDEPSVQVPQARLPYSPTPLLPHSPTPSLRLRARLILRPRGRWQINPGATRGQLVSRRAARFLFLLEKFPHRLDRRPFQHLAHRVSDRLHLGRPARREKRPDAAPFPIAQSPGDRPMPHIAVLFEFPDAGEVADDVRDPAHLAREFIRREMPARLMLAQRLRQSRRFYGFQPPAESLHQFTRIDPIRPGFFIGGRAAQLTRQRPQLFKPLFIRPVACAAARADFAGLLGFDTEEINQDAPPAALRGEAIEDAQRIAAQPLVVLNARWAAQLALHALKVGFDF